MKKLSMISAAVVLVMSTAFGQSDGLFVGVATSFHYETWSRAFNNRAENGERNSSTQFLGTGIRIEQKLTGKWGLNLGLNYLERQYSIITPYNHCYFTPPGLLCSFELKTINGFGYKTIEIPLGINKYFATKGRWELYLSLNTVTAFNVQSLYNTNNSKGKIITNNTINLSSSSLTSSMGFGYRLTDGIKINIEPFVRLVHQQYVDPVLDLNCEKHKVAYADDFGGHLLFLVRL